MRPSVSCLLSPVFLIVLAAGAVLAQTPPAGQAPPAPQIPAPAPQPPAAPAVQAPGQPPRPFPEGAKVAFVDFQRIASESVEGKNATAKVKALNDKKVSELGEKNKQLQATQDKLQKGGTVLSDSARAQLEKDIERIQVDIQRFTQDAQAEVQELQQELMNDFQRKALPIIGQVAAEKGLHMVFSRFDSGLVWADMGLDITTDVIKRFDAAKESGSAPAKPPVKPPK